MKDNDFAHHITIKHRTFTSFPDGDGDRVLSPQCMPLSWPHTYHVFRRPGKPQGHFLLVFATSNLQAFGFGTRSNLW